MKKFVALFVVLGMAGIASASEPITLGYSDDFEDYTYNSSLVGQGPWISAPYGGGAGDPPGNNANADIGGIGTGEVAAYGGSSWAGAAVDITGADSGVVDLNFMMAAGPAHHRKMIYIEGDGQQGNNTNRFEMVVYHDSYGDMYWNTKGNGPDQDGSADWSQYPIFGAAEGGSTGSWYELHFEFDFTNNAMAFEYRDVDDADGTPLEAYTRIIDGIGIPFTSLTQFAYTATFGYKATIDNFSLTSGLVAGGFASDFDDDGDVDGDDFLNWQNHFPTTSGAVKSGGDADSDGDVDGDDFLVWQNQFPSPGAVANTPEPASLALLGLGGLLMLRRRNGA